MSSHLGHSTHSHDLRVVWAEDSDSDQFLIRAAVADTPYESNIRFAFDGSEALHEIARRRPTGVVLDVNMPNMDGITALKRIRRDHADLPVIMFSTAHDVEQVRECRRLGVLAYEVKPVEFEDFCAVILRMLARFQGPHGRGASVKV